MTVQWRSFCGEQQKDAIEIETEIDATETDVDLLKVFVAERYYPRLNLRPTMFTESHKEEFKLLKNKKLTVCRVLCQHKWNSVS
jgi:hypothetical protein